MGSRWSRKALQGPGVIEDMSWAHMRTSVPQLEVCQDMWQNSTDAAGEQMEREQCGEGQRGDMGRAEGQWSGASHIELYR